MIKKIIASKPGEDTLYLTTGPMPTWIDGSGGDAYGPCFNRIKAIYDAIDMGYTISKAMPVESAHDACDKAYKDGYNDGFAAGKEEGHLEVLREELKRLERKIGDHDAM